MKSKKPIKCFQKSKRREFLDLAERLYGWSLTTARSQFDMWERGIRDVSIHDATFTIMESLEAFDNQEVA